MPELARWQTFFAVEAGAAATLSGLVFVAVSLNLARIMAVPGLPGRAGESLMQFVQVLFIASALLIPDHSRVTAASAVLGFSGFFWCGQIYAQVRYAKQRQGHPLYWLMTRVVMTQLTNVPFFVAGFGILSGASWALGWIVPGFFFSLFSGVISAWVLLVEILR